MAAKQVVFRISAQVLIEEINSLINIVNHLNSAYCHREWAIAIYLCDELKIRIASLKGSLDLSEEEKRPFIEANDDFRLITPQLHKLHQGQDLKKFESRFLNSLAKLIEGLCWIKNRAAGDLTGKKDVG